MWNSLNELSKVAQAAAAKAVKDSGLDSTLVSPGDRVSALSHRPLTSRVPPLCMLEPSEGATGGSDQYSGQLRSYHRA